MQTCAIKLLRNWRVLLLLAAIPALTNCSRIEGSVELRDSEGAAYSFEGARVDVFELNADAFLGNPRAVKGTSTAANDNTLPVDIVTSLIDESTLYGVEVQCPAANNTDNCNVESPLRVVLNGAQLMAGGWKATALTEAAFHNIAYYAAARYSVANIRHKLDDTAAVLLKAELSGPAKNYDDLLAWQPTADDGVKRQQSLHNVSESLAAGISNNDIKLLVQRWLDPRLANVAIPLESPDSYLHSIEVVDGYAYVGGVGPGISIINVNDPQNPVLEAQTGQDYRYSNGFNVAAGYLYGMQNGDLHIFDVRNPQQPTSVGKLFLNIGIRGIAVRNDHVYVASYDDVFIVNVANPAAPRLIRTLKIKAETVTPCGIHICTANESGFHVIDARNPTTAKVVGSVAVSSSFSISITASAEYAYLASYNGLSIIDIRNPTAPTIVAHPDLQSRALHSVDLSGNTLYLSSWNELLTVDVSDPATPRLIGEKDMTETQASIFTVQGGLAYLLTYQKSLTIMDFTALIRSPIHSGHMEIDIRPPGISTSGHYAFLPGSDGVYAVDLSNPVTPVLAATYGAHTNYSRGATAGNYAYFTDDTYGFLRTLNISDPAAPINVYGRVYFESDDLPSGLNEPVSAGDRVFLPWGNGGLGLSYWQCSDSSSYEDAGGVFAIDISLPEKPWLSSNICLANRAMALAMKGNHAYVAVAGGLLQVIDYNDLEAPAIISDLRLTASPNFIALTGNTAWLTLENSGIDIVSIENPAAPAALASIEIPGYTSSILFSERYAYVANGLNGVVIFDIRDARQPVLVARIDTTYPASRLFLFDNYLYVASNEGLEIFKAFPGSR